MKLWLVIYVGMHVGGSAGPLPYGMEVCVKHRDNLRASKQEVIDTGYSKTLKRKVTLEEIDSLKEMRFECEESAERPSGQRS